MTVNGRHRLLRAVVGVVFPLALVVVSLLPVLLYGDRLPEPIATHWAAGNRPDGTMSLQGFVLFNLAFVGIPAAILAVVSRRAPAHRGEIAPAVAICSFMATVAAAVSWLVVLANLDAPSWAAAESVGFAAIGLVLVLGGAVATVAAVLARQIETDPTPAPVVPSAGLGEGVRGVWVGSVRASWALPLVVGFVVGGVVLAFLAHPVLGGLFGLVGLAGLPFTSLRVIADRRGLRIEYGALGHPVQQIPLADIRQASAVDLRPMQWGGWGYRGALRLAGKAAVVLRAGEALRLDLEGGKVFAVTVDDAASAAGLLNDLVAAPSR